MRLPESLNAEAVEASYANGVLEVRIPVLEQAKPRKVEVRKVEVRQADDQPELAA
jgi:HSP20 family protein